jgi:pimeloyl-ACP methyl ester carboxylesterase
MNATALNLDTELLSTPASPTLPTGKVARLSPALKGVALVMRGLDRLAPSLGTEMMFRYFVRPRRRLCDYRSQLPAGARRLDIAYRDQTLTGWRWGDHGPAVLLVHGWEDHCGAMLALVEPLLQRGFRVVTMDAPGHGLSPAMDTHLLDTGEALAALMEQAGRFEAIIAHSYGAAATSLLLARQPHWAPDHLTLVSPMQDIRQHMAIFAGIAGLSPAAWSRLQHRVQDQLGQALDGISILSAASRFSAPGLVIHDRQDPLIPYAVSARLVERWRSAQLLATEGLGHRRTLRCRELVGRIATHIERELRASSGRPERLKGGQIHG